MAAGLRQIGFEVYEPDGTYFITTDISPLGEQDAMEFRDRSQSRPNR